MSDLPTITAKRIAALMQIGRHSGNLVALHILAKALNRREAPTMRTVRDLSVGDLVDWKTEDNRVYISLTKKGKEVYQAAHSPDQVSEDPREGVLLGHVDTRSYSKILRGEE